MERQQELQDATRHGHYSTRNASRAPRNRPLPWPLRSFISQICVRALAHDTATSSHSSETKKTPKSRTSGNSGRWCNRAELRMPFPLAPHHVQLINSCYPPASALVAAGPDYKPNSQEVSRLAYYASNRPGKIAKLASDLEKRALGDARKAAVGNARSRA